MPHIINDVIRKLAGGRFGMEMDVQGVLGPSSPEASKTGTLESIHGFENPGFRSKTSLRLIYEAQTQVIQKQIGDLESVRLKLGLNARKICQLLMVDPSAWNRWTRPGATAPPHIWRALQWYMIVQEKLPGLTPQFFIERVVTKVEKTVEKTVERVVDVPAVEGDAKVFADYSGDLFELRARSQDLIQQLESQNRLLQEQAEQIQRLKMTLIVGLCLCFGLVAGLLTYQVKRASTPPWEKQPAIQAEP